MVTTMLGRIFDAAGLEGAALPDAALESADHRRVDEMLADHRSGDSERGASVAFGEDDPEVAAMLDELMRERETRWADEPLRRAMEGLVELLDPAWT
jgi:hypothetical protein